MSVNYLFSVQTTLIDEDFESYSAGTFPSNGWVLTYNGAGNSYQVVTTAEKYSGYQSMQLKGSAGWSAAADYRLSEFPTVIYYEGYMKSDGIANYPSIGFCNRDEGAWGANYANVSFKANTTEMYVNDTYIQNYTVGQWYKIKLMMDTNARTVTCWIDDILRVSDLSIVYGIGYKDFSFGNNGTSKSYYDKLKVWYETDTSTGPVGYWKFDEGSGTTAIDSSGNGNNGTISGATYITGKSGNALSFDGVNDYVSIINPNNLPYGSNSRTIMLWINSSQWIQNAEVVVWGNDNSGQKSAIALTSTADPNYKNTFFFWGYFSDVQANSYKNINNWYHVAFIYNGSVGKIFINGVEEKSSNLSLNTSITSLFIGSGITGTGDNFLGKIDEVKIYNRALSQAEIQADMNSTPQITYSISGYVKDNSSTAINGVNVSLSGSASSSTLTNTSGYYEFSNLSTGTYTVTPTKTGYTFSPTNRPYLSLSSNQTNQDFFGTVISSGISGAGLVGYWKFDEGSGTTATDSSGNGNNGTILGATYVTGKSGNALSFDGVNDYVEVNNNGATNFEISTQNYTISLWVKFATVPSLGNDVFIIIDRSTNNNSPCSWSIYYGGNNVEGNDYNTFIIQSWNGSQQNNCYNPNTHITTNSWYYISVVFDTQNIKHYVNGILDSLRAISISGTKNNEGINIGRFAGAVFVKYFNGMVDELKIYNRALSQAEIQADMNSAIQIASGTISGKVTKADGVTALTSVTVEAYKGISLMNQATTDTSGNYSLTLSSGQNYDVRFSKQYYATRTEYSIPVGTGTTTLNVSLTETYGYIAGKVTKVDGVTGIRGCIVNAMQGISLINQATTDSSGNYSVYVPTGSYDLTISSNVYLTWTASNVQVYSSSTTTANASLSANFGTISGVVRDNVTSNTISGVLVKILQNNSLINQATTDLNGSYSINLSSGSYDVKAIKTGYVSEKKTGYNVLVDSQIAVNFSLLAFNKPTVTSASHSSQNAWYNSSSPSFTWAAVTGAVSYYYLLDGTAGTVVSPINWATTMETTKAYTGIAEGIKYFHIVAVDIDGNFSSQEDYVIKIDTTPPTIPILTSPTHPDNNVSYLSKKISITIAGTDNLSVVAGYYYIFNTSSGTVPAENTGTFLTAITSPINWATTVGIDGTYYFHCVAKDNAGNVGTAVAHFKASINTSVIANQNNDFIYIDSSAINVPSGTLNSDINIVLSSFSTVEIKIPFDENVKETGIEKEVWFGTAGTEGGMSGGVGGGGIETGGNGIAIWQKLNKEITITLYYSDSDILGFDESKLRVLVYYNNQWQLVKSVVTITENKIRITTNKTGKFMIVAFTQPTEALSSVSSYPNPFYCGKDNVKIRYVLKEDSNVKVTLIDTTGALIMDWELKAGEDGAKAGPNELVWDGKNSTGDYVTPGLYLVKIESKGKTQIWKMGVK